jgi:rhamnopyranosyl-N-acetylglucosaminyl-diphospho-decaprenol beta-1,3/1,4-galactofuranosyltransferase
MENRVCAVVATYNRRHLLTECLAAVQGQSRPVQQILVVNNASADGTAKMLRAKFPAATVINLAQNIGCAGGYHTAMRWAFEHGYDWIWCVDDDGRPAADCLAHLLKEAAPNTIRIPLLQDPTGRRFGATRWLRGKSIDVAETVADAQSPLEGDFLFAFAGALIARDIVERIGLPNKDFFFAFEDAEYTLRAWRQADTKSVMVPTAIYEHPFYGAVETKQFLWWRHARYPRAPWKHYYDTRNRLYTLTRIAPDPIALARYLQNQARGFVGDLLFEEDRWLRARLRLRGIRDGLRGQLGPTVPVS